MDSSRTAAIENAGFTPWQAGRIRDRLMNYKSAKRHGWERIATDILFAEDLPEDYVESEDVRPLSESLRRLVGGTQTPSPARLNAVKVFLISQGYLDARDLEESNAALQAPMAFADFISGGQESARRNLSRLDAFDGTFSLVDEYPGEVVHKLVSLKFQNGFFLVQYREAFLKNIDSRNRLINTPSVRRRAMSREDRFEGWAACGPFKQIVIFANEVAFAQRPKFFLIWAEQQRDDQAAPAEAVMLMPYEGVRGTDALEEIKKNLETGAAQVPEPVINRLMRPAFQIFTRSEGKGG